MKCRPLSIAVAFLLPTLCVARSDRAGFTWAWYVPYDRLIANTEAFIRDHPDDPQGHYTLARMHYFTFVNRMSFVPTSSPKGYPPENVAGDWQLRDVPAVPRSSSGGYHVPFFPLEPRYAQAEDLVLQAWGCASRYDVPSDKWLEFWRAVSDKERELEMQGWEPEYLDVAAALAHAATAVDSFERALDLDPNNGLFYLGVASLYEECSLYTADVNVASYPPQLACITVPRTRVMYYLAYRLAVEEDRQWDHRPESGLRRLVSYEAGTAYLRLANEEPPIADANSIAQIAADLAKFETLSVRITPIVLSTQAHGSVLDLLDPNTHVIFDLDGTGRRQRWSWIKPTTGLLVWDPSNQGEITSGRQLFGTATWWLLFPDGYHALDTLDDTRDGILSGDELKGISVWFDKNTNGRSEPGEVQPVTDFGVQAIRTRPTGFDHGMLTSSQGIVMKDGTAVPSYDWLVSLRL